MSMITKLENGVLAEWNGRYQMLRVGKHGPMIVLSPESVKQLAEWQTTCENAKSWRFSPACEVVDMQQDGRLARGLNVSTPSELEDGVKIEPFASFSRVKRLNETEGKV